MLQVALSHAGTDGELIEEINALLADLEKELPPEVVATARQRAERMQLEEVVEDLLSRGLPGMPARG